MGPGKALFLPLFLVILRPSRNWLSASRLPCLAAGRRCENARVERGGPLLDALREWVIYGAAAGGGAAEEEMVMCCYYVYYRGCLVGWLELLDAFGRGGRNVLRFLHCSSFFSPSLAIWPLIQLLLPVLF